MVHIRDPIHGDIHFAGVLEEVVKTEEFQRLSDVKQLGLTDKIYPGASHTRFSHSIGVSYLAGQLAKKLNVPEKDVLLIQLAALLHDVGHYDFSHALEKLAPCMHEENSANIIMGKATLPNRKSGEIARILKSHGIEPQKIVDLLNKKGDYPKFYHSILSGRIIDVDRMDYLKRDTYYSGAVIGEIDVGRLLHVLVVHPKSQMLGIREKGLASLEQFLMARIHMYRQVYMHGKSLIGELMLAKAVELSQDVASPILYGDGHLLARLVDSGTPKSRELIQRIRAGKRSFYKPALEVRKRDEMSEGVEKLKDSGVNVEEKLRNMAGLENGDVLVSFMHYDETVEFPEFPVLMRDGEWLDLFDISPLAKAVMIEKKSDFIFGVYCDESNIEIVRKAVLALLSNQ